MTDREDLLRAIDANPEDLNLRCIYADWLQEHGTSEADAATAEWIMLTCFGPNLTKTGRIKRTSFAWLKENWERLVATARAKHMPAAMEREIEDRNPDGWGELGDGDYIRLLSSVDTVRWTCARVLVTGFSLYPDSLASVVIPRSYRVEIAFGRGFVERFEASNPTAQKQLNHLVLADQPLCRIAGLSRTCGTCGHEEQIGDQDYIICGGRWCPAIYRKARRNVYEMCDGLPNITARESTAALPAPSHLPAAT